MKIELPAFALSLILFTFSTAVEAQNEKKIHWIGYLAGAGSGPDPAFIEGLRDLGYVEAKNIAIAP